MKIAIIGLGRVYQHYKKNFVLSLLDDGHFIYLYDTDPLKRESLMHPKHENLFITSSFDELISSDIDFAIVSTISGTHYEISKKLMEARIHILTEKPATMK